MSLLLLRRWRLSRAAVPLARETPDGTLARIAGTVVPTEELLVGPLTGETCVAVRSTFRLRGGTADENKPQPFGNGRIDDITLAPFHVDAGALRVLVLSPTATFLTKEHPAANMQREQSLRARHGMTAATGIHREQLVCPGDRICVIGRVHRDGGERPDVTNGFRDAVAMITLVGSTREPVVLT